MKILIAPLNWGLGHASRCIPLIEKYLTDGCEVVIAGDGDSLTLLRKRFPQLRTIDFPHLNLKYSKTNSQTWALAKALPRLITWIIKDHHALKKLLVKEHFDRIISDNRFGFYVNLKPKSRYFRHKKPRLADPTKEPETIYITHQLLIKTPKGFAWLEPLLASMHRDIILKYTHCWIPDFAGPYNLSADLSHKLPLPRNAKFIGPISRFPVQITNNKQHQQEHKQNYQIVAVLSGLEPQRTIFEKQIINQYLHSNKKVLIVRGKTSLPFTTTTNHNITIVPYLDDQTLQHVLLNAELILARSGYSTIMDLYQLNCIHKAQLTPTPGQPEQEYLATISTIKNTQIIPTTQIISTTPTPQIHPFARHTSIT